MWLSRMFCSYSVMEVGHKCLEQGLVRGLFKRVETLTMQVMGGIPHQSGGGATHYHPWGRGGGKNP